jgi:hypothetical protein
VSLCEANHVEIVSLEYLQEALPQNEEMLQSQLAFIKSNSSHFHLNLFMPKSIGETIMQSNGINIDIHAFYEHISRVLSDAIIFTYNVTNLRSYLKKYDKRVPVCSGTACEYENLYKVLFRVNTEESYLYFSIDELYFFL